MLKKVGGITLRVVLLTIAVFGAGCASFPKEGLKNSQIPDVSGYQHKPRVYLDVKFFQGSPTEGRAVEMPSLQLKVKPIVEKVAGQSQLFSSITFDPFDKQKPDQTIQLYFYNYGSSGGSTVAGLLCGFTFGIIPAAATDNYTLASKVVTGSTNDQALMSNDSVTTWIGIWFLPAAGHTPEKAMNATFEDLVRDAMRQLVESKQLQLSSESKYLFIKSS